MDYNARYYNPRLGRFVSPDSIVPDPSSSSGFNRYRYTRNNPLKYTDPTGHQDCEDGEDNCNPLVSPEDKDGDDDTVSQSPLQESEQSPLQESEREWDWVPDGVRLDVSGWVPVLFFLGGDVNIDFVSANWDPQETSVIIGASILGGIGEGGAVSAGPIWHDAKDIEEYKTISNNLGGTIVVVGGVEANGAISGSTGAKSLYVGIGGGEELSGWYGKQLVTFDVFRGDLTLGGEVHNVQINLWGEGNDK